MIKAILSAPTNKAALLVSKIAGSLGKYILITERLGRLRGSFKSVTNSGSQTQTIAEPTASGLGSIALTDLIIAADQTQNATVTVQFTDDTDTEIIFTGDASNNTINLAIAFQGNWQGWSGARLELVTDTLGQNVTAVAGYYKVSEDDSLTYGAWNALR